MDVLYGKNPVLEALRSGRKARKLIVAQGVREEGRLSEIRQVAREREILIEESPRQRLDDIAHNEHHQGIVGYFHSRDPLSVQDLLDGAKSPGLFLVLDGIQDPQNLGAIARSAEATGVDGIIVSRHHATAVTPAVVKASAGATEHLSIAYVPNLVRALDELKAAGVWSVGLDAEAPAVYDQFDYTTPVAIVVGAEGAGMRQLTKEHCDALVALPMVGKVSSLNAAVAGGILLYEALRQRRAAKAG